VTASPPPPPPPPKALRLAKPKPLERDIEGPVCAYARAKGFYVRKFVSPAHRSVPDRLLGSPGGVVFFIEFKRPGGKATPEQLREHTKIKTYGLDVFVIDDIIVGKSIVDGYSDFQTE